MSTTLEQTAVIPDLAASEPAVTVSEAAAVRISELIEEEGNYNLKLRVSIHGGGCSGFQYGFAFDTTVGPDDTVFEKTVIDPSEKIPVAHTVSVIVDPLSMMYLQGSQIDYIESLQGAHFTVKNPNAQTTCSCGSSFSI